MNSHPFLSGLRDNPDFLLQNLDFRNQRGLLVKISERAYRQASFLDERVFEADTQGAWFPLETLLEIAADIPIRQAPHYIFHVGHCGSTLISRLLGELPQVFSLREPVTLLALAVIRRELGTAAAPLDRDAWDRIFRMSLALLSRTYHAADRPFIKLTSAAGNLLGPLLGAHADSKALLLYVDLETYLATMLRAETPRENLRAYAAVWLKDFHQFTGRHDIQLNSSDDARQAVINWLTMLLTFSRATTQHPGNTFWLNFDTFLGAPTRHLQAAADFFNLPVSSNAISMLMQGPLMNHYAKDPGQVFDAHARQRELADARGHLEVEIRTALDWAASLCMDIPALEPVIPYLRAT